MPKLITDADERLLQETISYVRSLRQNSPRQSGPDRSFNEGEDHQAPEVYIALPPSEGIPALGDVAMTGTGTGSGTVNPPPLPGSAECQFYEIAYDPIDGDYLQEIPELIHTVYNISSAVVTGWIIAVRDKSGKWVAVSPGAGTDEDTGTECESPYECIEVVTNVSWDESTCEMTVTRESICVLKCTIADTGTGTGTA